MSKHTRFHCNVRVSCYKPSPRVENMAVTKQVNFRNPDDFPTLQLFLLGTTALHLLRCTKSHATLTNKRQRLYALLSPIALTSIFPHAWALVKAFHIGNEQDASFYAGILISSFSLWEALTGLYWGSLSDSIGQKPVLLFGCVGTMFSMLW